MRNPDLLASVVVGALMFALAPRRADPPLVQVGSIPLPNVQGRIDHLAVDPRAQRLYVAALGNNTVEVLDLKNTRHEKTAPGFKEPEGIAVVPETSTVVVANGQGEGAEFRTSGDLRLIRSVPLGDDADNVRVDTKAKRVYVGYGSGAIAALDAADARKVGEAPVGGHPESFQLEVQGLRLFVNVPAAHHVSVIDREHMKVMATWPVTAAEANYPMALDERNRRLFIGCRKPPVVLVYDTESGKQTGSVEIAADTDDVFWDDKRQRLYVTAGEGFIDVVDLAGGTPHRTAHIPTAAGARTSLFVAARDRLYLAVPHRGSQAAEIRIFQPRD